MADVSSTLSSQIERIVASSTVLSERYHGIILPWCTQMAERLELPAWNLYRDAWAICTRDVLQASSSVYNLSYLTLKPILLLVWILLGHLWRFLLEHGGRSLHKAAIHLKMASIHFYRFQISLNKTQILGEAALLAMCVGLYYLRKWLLKQTYWAKFQKWYKLQKRKTIRSYTNTVHKIAKVSKILAMALPHLVFLAVGIGLIMVLPGLVRWITYETPTVVLLSLYYPFFSTLAWVHSQRHDFKSTHNNNTTSTSKNEIHSKTSPSKESQTTTANANANANQSSSNSNSAAERKKKFVQKAKAKASKTKKSAPSFVVETASLETTKYWLQYWQLYAFVQAFGSCVSMIPIVGRFLISHPIVGFLTGECKLLFFVWIFGMEKILGKTAAKDAFLAEALPLRLLHKFIRPLVLQLHTLVSDAISKEFWQKWVVSKSKTILDISVMVRAISSERKDWLLHIVEESRVLTLPSITLLMPGFVTQFGVAYVQYMVPSAKSAEASSSKTKLVYLQYWILHCGTAGLLHKLSGVLWWIPFSSHLIFLVWSYLVLPQSIQSWYGIVESELLAFGILPQGAASSTNNESAVKISETKTAWLFQSLVQRLPSAASNEREEEQEPDIQTNSTKEEAKSLQDESSLQVSNETVVAQESKIQEPVTDMANRAVPKEPAADASITNDTALPAKPSPDVIPVDDDDDDDDDLVVDKNEADQQE